MAMPMPVPHTSSARSASPLATASATAMPTEGYAVGSSDAAHAKVADVAHPRIPPQLGCEHVLEGLAEPIGTDRDDERVVAHPATSGAWRWISSAPDMARNTSASEYAPGIHGADAVIAVGRGPSLASGHRGGRLGCCLGGRQRLAPRTGGGRVRGCAERVHEWCQGVHQGLVTDVRAAHAHDHVACFCQGSGNGRSGPDRRPRCLQRGAAPQHAADGQECRAPERPRRTTGGVTERVSGRDEGRGCGRTGPGCRGGGGQAAHHAHTVVTIAGDGIQPAKLRFRRR